MRVFRSKFDQLLTRVQILIDEGVTRDSIVSEIDIADLNWPMPATRIEQIYDELTR